MKKLLLSSVAVLGLAVAAPAFAQDDSALKLDLGGHYKGYASLVDQDEAAGTDVNTVDWLQETELHFQGETTLDNGLTVGAHIEAEVDGGDNAAIDESYAYFSGAWGRINAGDEDGSAYLLQVAAPSADSNVDGIRQFVTGINSTAAGIATPVDGLDYDNDIANDANKLTYLTPVLNGFQAGVSYTPDVNGVGVDANGNPTGNQTRSLGGNGITNANEGFGAAYEGAVRYEGAFNNVGYIAGAGYTLAEDDRTGAGTDSFEEWNVGLDLDIGAFGLGAVYTENNNGLDGAGDSNDTIVVGADYTTGPFKLGASWLNNDNDLNTDEIDRYTGGVVYTYGPGMSFRGSVSYVDQDDVDGTNVLLGTQVNF
jgi:predicted porin